MIIPQFMKSIFLFLLTQQLDNWWLEEGKFPVVPSPDSASILLKDFRDLLVEFTDL
jgi:hypothetical protein